MKENTPSEYFNMATNWVQKNLKKETWSTMISTSILCSSFYCLQMLTQRCYGMMKLHGGRSNILLGPIGAISTCSTLLISQNIETIIRKNANQFGLGDHLIYKPVPVKQERRDNIKRLFLGMCSFIFLEQSLFRSCFPSSVITLGVFGQLHHRFRRSVETNDPITTAAQRFKIQKLGRRFGCHHCGSRQLFSREVFIADHMPPTKIATSLSKAWWRKLFKRPVLQRLWPQCQKCYSLQGSAVKNGIHSLAYHSVFKRFHLAPGIAFLLVQNKEVSDSLDQLLDPVVDRIEKFVVHHMGKSS